MELISNDTREILNSGLILLHGTRQSKVCGIMQIGLVCATQEFEDWGNTLLVCSDGKHLNKYWWQSRQDDTPRVIIVYSIPKELITGISDQDFIEKRIHLLCEEKMNIIDPTLSKEDINAIVTELKQRNETGKRLDFYRSSDEELRKLIGLSLRLVLPSIFVLGVMNYETKNFEWNPNHISKQDNYQQYINYYKSKISGQITEQKSCENKI